MKAKKSYGQHFLRNENVARRIVGSLVNDYGYKHLIEVGPGKGMLTQYLLEGELDLLVVEADRDMVEYLKLHFPELENKIIASDFLKLDLQTIFPEEHFGLIGNFPYNISSQILFKMLSYKEQIPELVGMFQRELAERVVAAPGSKTYGVISVLVQAFYEGKILFEVGHKNFSPPPKVQSSVIRLLRKNSLRLDCDEKLFKSIVKQSFNQRRKMLRNTLKNHFPKDHACLKDPFFQQRPERLSVADFVKVTNWIEKVRDQQ